MVMLKSLSTLALHDTPDQLFHNPIFFTLNLLLKFAHKPVYDEVQQCPYVLADNMFIGYDNKKSWQTKIRWMKKAGYGGVIVWALDLDDFNGTFCGEGIRTHAE